MNHVITWANRHRTLQADQHVDWLAAGTGAEPGQHYALQVRDAADNLLAEKLDIDGLTATVESDHAGPLHFRLWTIRDGLDSWQAVEWSAPNTPTGTGTTITAATWHAPVVPPTQPSGEAIVADGITPPVQLTSDDETDFLFSD